MGTSKALETNSEILATAHAAVGFVPSKKQRDDWRRFGLLPGALSQHGKGKTLGSVAYYPPGTGDLLAAICRRSKPKKSLSDLAFLVWWDGSPVESTLIRERFGRLIANWEEQTAPWRDLSAVPAERNAEIDQLAHGRLPGPLKMLRDGVGGPGPLAALIKTILNVTGSGFAGFHGYPGATADDAEDDARHGFNLDRVDWFSGDLRTDLSNLSLTLHPETLRQALHQASDDDLHAARDECRLLDGLINDAGTIAAERGVPMLQPFALIRAYKPPPHHHGLFVVWWLSLRRLPVFRDRIVSLRMTAATLRAIRAQQQNGR